jgi:hypothetical protein
VKFKDLSVGDTFLKEDKHYLFMKSMPMTLSVGSNGPINAIVLNDGSVTELDDEDEVIVVECKVNILREGW